MAKKSLKSFRFDAALSFAGADRPRAEAVARAMQSLGLRVFYDRDHSSQLWGKNRAEYEKIYGPDSAFVVPLISQHYAERKWTQWEFESAKRESERRKEDFLLPIRLDDSRQFGLTDDHNYLSAGDFTPEEIAQALKSKLESEYGRPMSQRTTTRREGVVVLTSPAGEALGLIVSAPLPMTAGHLKSFFPDVDWSKHLRRLKQLGLVEDNLVIAAPKHINASFANEHSAFVSRWATRLEELQDHIDCCVFLALLHIKRGRLDDAVRLVADAALATDSDHWISLCRAILQTLNSDRRLARKLQPDSRLAFLRAFGHCLSDSGQFEEARAQFEKLRNVATRRKDLEWIGIALLNIGTTYHRQGDVGLARRFYEHARRHAASNQLVMLESHAIGNLAQIELMDDPESAIGLLQESIKLKEKCGDNVGIAGSKQVLAQAFAELEDYDASMQQYHEVEVLALDLENVYLQTLSQNNKAITLLQFGKRSEALRAFRRTRRLAEAEGFSELLVRATEGISRCLFCLGKLQDAQTSMEQLLELAKERGLFEFVMAAHHGQWAVKTRLGDLEGASKQFNALTRLARSRKAQDWLIRALVDKSRPVRNGDFLDPNPTRLRELVQREARRGDAAATAALWMELAHVHGPHDVCGAIDAIRKCIDVCKAQITLTETLLEALEFLYVASWEWVGQYGEGIETLEAIARVAKKSGMVEKELAAIDQKGACLQELDRCDEALPLHRLVAARARKHKLHSLEVNSLHNLGECYRRLGDSDSALRAFDSANTVAVDSGDAAAAIQIDHGKALTREQMGDFETAATLFNKCRVQSRRMEWWPEYLRACEAVADLSWTRGRYRTAVRQYQKALAECDAWGVIEAKAGIALRLSRLLRLLGEVHEAREVLARHLDLVDDLLLKPEIHSALGRLSEETGRPEDAQVHWRIAVQSAESIGDEDDLDCYRSEQAACEQRINDGKKTITEWEEELAGDLTPRDRGTALVRRFSALLQREDEEYTEKAFEVAQEYLHEHGMNEELANLYMAIFDYDWNGNRESRLEALQAYVAAFGAAAACQESEECLVAVCGQAMVKLTLPESAPSPAQLAWLADRLEQWLVEQSGDGEYLEVIMHPLRYAEKLIPFNREPARFLEEHDRLFATLSDEA